ncbi:MAG: Sensor phosphatase, partial [Frankiales bacterium]|nr:Sensor phosphatase [Frankiales bacterium]
MDQPTDRRSSESRSVDHRVLFAAIPTPYLVMTPDLVIVDANAAYLANVGRDLDDLRGRPVFEAFPPGEDALDEHGVPRVQVSLERARDTGRVDVMPLQRYDIPDPATGGTVRRFWSLISVPVLDDDGRCALVVQRAEDITDVVNERDRGETAEREQGQAWRRRVEQVETDLYARAQELTAAVQEKETAGRLLAALAEVALQISGAETVGELTEIVFRAGLPALGSVGGAVAVRTGDELALTITQLGEQARQTYARLPLEGSLPACVAARGSLVVIPDVEASQAYEGMADVLALTGTSAWVALPLSAGDRLLGSMTVGWVEPQVFTADRVELLRAFAAQCASVLDRLQVRQTEREAALAVLRVSETLQRSLLTAPPVVAGLDIAVRYLPASQIANVGGDWYDAFTTPDGALSLVIGDVAGHDEDAAAAMAQVRNVLRGVAQTLGEPPAAVLAGLDRALEGLRLTLLATVVLAQLVETPGGRRLTWCNAGHPPPLLLRADG